MGILDFTTVPAGTYLCRVDDVRQGQTRSGDERWSLQLVVSEGQYTGRLAAWDALVFSVRGTARARQILAALGLPPDRNAVQPADLIGRQAFVEVRPVEFQASGGDRIRRNEVPYDGIAAAEGGAS